jgi:DNA modification methylase
VPDSIPPTPEGHSLDLKVEYRLLESLQPYSGNARTHSQRQVAQIAASIRRFGFVSPVLLGEDDVVIAGHGRIEAARSLAMAEVPTIRLDHLSPAERRAYLLADNRLAELAGWDTDLLALELKGLEALDLDFELELTGFDGTELERLLGRVTDAADDPEDQVPEATGPAVTRPGDVWVLGPHRLHCGDARDPQAYDTLMAGELARMVFADPPYNVAIDGHAGGKGRIARRPFIMASGEMSSEEFTTFLTETLSGMAGASTDGAIAFICMDWRHLPELLAAGAVAYDEMKNLIVWTKDNGGMGAFYRSQHELIGVFKKGRGPHVNTFGLGENGRYRTNVWSYPGVNSFTPGREEALAWHPTVKPVAMVADAIRDVSHRGEIVLDAFGGSGTTLIAAHRTGRRARLLELDPLYCDVICRRWAAASGEPALLEGCGRVFDTIAEARTDV